MTLARDVYDEQRAEQPSAPKARVQQARDRMREVVALLNEPEVQRRVLSSASVEAAGDEYATYMATRDVITIRAQQLLAILECAASANKKTRLPDWPAACAVAVLRAFYRSTTGTDAALWHKGSDEVSPAVEFIHAALSALDIKMAPKTIALLRDADLPSLDF